MSREQKKNILVYSFHGIVVILLMVYAGIRNNERSIELVEVNVQDQEGVFFTDDLEIMELLSKGERGSLIGTKMNALSPKILEYRIEQNPFVKNAEVYRDLAGELSVKVQQNKPIARLFTNGKDDRYIDSDGGVLPINAKYTARVPLIETAFEWTENMNETSFGKQVFSLLKYIESNPFWKAQIAHIFVKRNGEIELYPQVTKQKIEFGKPIDFDRKFSKLMIFYKEILPKKGWNSYERVNIKFENQIICE